MNRLLALGFRNKYQIQICIPAGCVLNSAVSVFGQINESLNA